MTNSKSKITEFLLQLYFYEINVMLQAELNCILKIYFNEIVELAPQTIADDAPDVFHKHSRTVSVFVIPSIANTWKESLFSSFPEIDPFMGESTL